MLNATVLIRCSPNYTIFFEHLDIVFGLVYAQYQAISGVLHLLELLDSQKSPQELKNMNLKYDNN
jgi:hypothetical protein